PVDRQSIMTALIAVLPWPEAQAFIIMRVSSREDQGCTGRGNPQERFISSASSPFLYPSDRGLLSLAMELAHDTARARSKLKRYHHAVSK
ncbi:hypothetical protein, partial [Klebsiella pneumoniae]|uniref:hypothetical protein n=1 Tax=Klebsiella pneumoniae TaxID=573 RepID=UPI001D0DF110